MSAPSRVLVAGSGGFIGAAVARLLRARGVQIIEAGRSAGVDLTTWSDVSALSDADAILHIAGRTYVPHSLIDPLPFYRDNVISTLHLLELARRRQSVFVLAGSYVYGAPRYLPIDELHPVSASNPYMASKLIAEQLCEAYHRDFGTPIVVLRIFNVYGEGQRDPFLVPAIAGGLRHGSLRLGSPSPRRDWVHVDDVAEAFAAALHFGGQGFEVFNIGSGASVSVQQLVESMEQLSGRKSRVEYGTHIRPAEIGEVVADIGKARRMLGWQPRVDLETGLRRVLAHEFQSAAGPV